MSTVYSASRIHLREWCTMHHTTVRLNCFIKRYIGLIEQRISYKIDVMTYKVRLHQQAQYLRELINDYLHARFLRSSNNALLIVPSTKTVTQLTLFMYQPHKYGLIYPSWSEMQHHSTNSTTCWKDTCFTSLFDRHDHHVPLYCHHDSWQIMAPLTNNIDIVTSWITAGWWRRLVMGGIDQLSFVVRLLWRLWYRDIIASRSAISWHESTTAITALLESVKEEQDLGIVIADVLKVSSYCQAAYNTANKILGMINWAITYQSKAILVPLHTFLVRPLVERCIPPWLSFYRKIKIQ